MLNESAGGTPWTRVGVPSVGVPVMPAGQAQSALPPPEPPLPPVLVVAVVVAPPVPPEPSPPEPPVVEALLLDPMLPLVVADVVVADVVAPFVAVVVSGAPPVVLAAVLAPPVVLPTVLLEVPAELLALSPDEVSSEPHATEVAHAASASRFKADACFIEASLNRQ